MFAVQGFSWEFAVSSDLVALKNSSACPWSNSSLKPLGFQWPETAGDSQKGYQLNGLVHHNPGKRGPCLQHRK